MEWLEADSLDRPMMLERLAKMGIGDFLSKETKENPSLLRAFCNIWNSYFEDFSYSLSQEIERRKMHPAQLGTSVKKK